MRTGCGQCFFPRSPQAPTQPVFVGLCYIPVHNPKKSPATLPQELGLLALLVPSPELEQQMDAGSLSLPAQQIVVCNWRELALSSV